MIADPRRGQGFTILRDLRAAKTPVNIASVIGIIEAVSRSWPQLEASRAAIVTADDIDLAAVAHALADEQKIPLRAFTSLAAAMEWLRHEDHGTT